jgi:GT2 family glycosyltransferase
MPEKAPGLSIVIPTRGHSETLAEVLTGLDRQGQAPTDVEVVIGVDAMSSDEDRERVGMLTCEFPLVVRAASRPGASAARNVAWRKARAPLILFLDDDIVPARNLVAEHLAWHRRSPQPEVGVLGLVRWSPRVKVTPFMRWLETGIQFDYRTIRTTAIGWQRFYTCNVSVKREMLDRVGGFDELRFPFGYEDLELARRMSRHGFRLLFNARAVGEHLKTETLDSWRRNLARIATAERRFTELYPNERPYFYERFRAAAGVPVARGRFARLAPFVGPGVPWLGRRVWGSYDLVCSQRLAPGFLAEWEAAGT